MLQEDPGPLIEIGRHVIHHISQLKWFLMFVLPNFQICYVRSIVIL
jgi:hypothetical protein